MRIQVPQNFWTRPCKRSRRPCKRSRWPCKRSRRPCKRSRWPCRKINLNQHQLNNVSFYTDNCKYDTLAWWESNIGFHRTIGKTVSSDWYFRVRDKIILLKWYFLFMKNLTLWTGNSTKSIERTSSIVKHAERQSLFSI